MACTQHTHRPSIACGTVVCIGYVMFVIETDEPRAAERKRERQYNDTVESIARRPAKKTVVQWKAKS